MLCVVICYRKLEGDINDFKGQKIKGYELIAPLGEGAFGAVYRARQTQIGREVAIKVIRAEHANRPAFIRRFEIEAQIIAQLEHLHIVPLYDYWREPDGAFLVMRLMKGGSLVDLLAEGEVEPQKALILIKQTAMALQAVHARGVVHRDLKPANILLDESGNAYLTDFGIAKDIESQTDLTATGSFIGTPAYTTPEQAQSTAVTPQTDIYALGVVLYEMLAGGHPFPDTPLGGMLVKHIVEPLPLLQESHPHLPVGIDEIIQRATAKEPGARYENALDLVADLEGLMAGSSQSTAPDVEVELDAPNPYKGLRAFQEGDAPDFFGRSKLIEQILARMQENIAFAHFLAVVGPSGSGKSSVVKAGILPALRRGAIPGSEDWYVVEMLPGRAPFEELEKGLLKIATGREAALAEVLRKDARGISLATQFSLPTPEDHLLLVIDQFEELFTLVEDLQIRELFLKSLMEAISDPKSQLRVVVTLRVDFYDKPLMHPEFGPLIESRNLIVLPLNTEELSAAVRGPADRVGARFESGLVSKILAEVHNQPGSLPLLQYALTELYDEREGAALTHAGYAEIGGVLGALGSRAEQIYGSLNEEESDVARQIFLRLVTLGEGVEDTRRRVLRTELDSLSGDTRVIIDLFGAARLLAFDRDHETRGATVEVAHEALLREWSRLRDWLAESRADVRTQRLLAAAAAEWIEQDRDPGYLLSGTRLAQFEDWAQGSGVRLTPGEGQFLDDSLEKRAQTARAEAERRARMRRLELRTRTILRWLVGVMAAATVIAIVLSTFAFSQRTIASHNAGTATVAQGQAQIEAATARAAQGAAQQQSEVAARNAAEAIANEELAAVQARIALSHELASASARFNQLGADSDLGLLLALHSAEISLAETGNLSFQSEDALHTALRAARPRPLFIQTDTNYSALAVHPNGQLFAVAAGFTENEQTWRLLLYESPQSASVELLTTLNGHTDRINDLDFNADGSLLASASDEGMIIIWDVAQRDILYRLDHGAAVRDLSFSPAGPYLVTAGDDARVRIWDVIAGEEVFTFSEHAQSVSRITVTPDGSRIGSLSEDGIGMVWNAQNGQVLYTKFSEGRSFTDIVFDDDGHLALIDDKGPILILDAETGVLRNTICCIKSGGIGAFSPNSGAIISGRKSSTGHNETNFLYYGNLTDKDALEIFSFPSFHFADILFRGNGLRLFLRMRTNSTTLTTDSHVIALDYSFGRELPPLILPGELTNLAYSPDGQYLAINSVSDGVSIWKFPPEESQLNSQDYAYSLEGIVFSKFTIDATSLPSKLFTLPNTLGRNAVNDLVYHPAGELLATAGKSLSVNLWDVSGPELVELRALSGHNGQIQALAFNPEGSLLASASADRSAILWKLDTPEDITVLRGHNGSVLDVVFSPDGSLLATASEDQTIRLWDVLSGEVIRVLDGKSGAINSVGFSPDGKRLVSGSSDSTTLIWDVESGQRLRMLTLPGFQSPSSIREANSIQNFQVPGSVLRSQSEVVQVFFTKDGNRVITGRADGNIIIWDALTGKELFVLTGHESALTDVAMRSDGDMLASTGVDDTVNFYILDPERLMEYARFLITRELTREECDRYLRSECLAVTE